MSFNENKMQKTNLATIDKTKRREKNFKPYFIRVLLCLIFLSLFTVIQQVKLSNKTESYLAVVESKNLLKKENLIFRSMSPIKFSVPDLIKKAAVDQLLVPGWVTRVYSTGMKDSDLSVSLDLGSFIMNEIRFTLTSHKNYGIENPDIALYQMNGLYASNVAGKHQIAINSQQLLHITEKQRQVFFSSDCHVKVLINEKIVIDKPVRLSSYSLKQVTTGQIELAQGIFPISSKFYCDKLQGRNNTGPKFTVNFRSPDEYSFKNQGLSVYHIYDIRDD